MIINGKKLDVWGCCLESGDPLRQAFPMKEFVTNDNRLRHGIEVLRDAPRFGSKEITLVFGFYDNGKPLMQRFNKFIEEVYSGGNIVAFEGKYYILDYMSNVEFKSLKNASNVAIRFLVANHLEGEGLGDYNKDYNEDYKIG